MIIKIKFIPLSRKMFVTKLFSFFIIIFISLLVSSCGNFDIRDENKFIPTMNINSTNSISCKSTRINANTDSDKNLYIKQIYQFYLTPNPDMKMIFVSHIIFNEINYPIGNVSYLYDVNNDSAWASHFYSNRENTTTLQKLKNSNMAIIIVNHNKSNEIKFELDCAK